MASGSTTDGSPIFFYLEHETDFGFMSNFYYQSFTAPNPALWIHKAPHAPVTSSDAIEAEEQQQETIEFHNSEQYYMYCKALYFGDKDTAWMILKTKSPTECKSLGRAVKPFSQEEWEKDDFNVRVMEEALWWKFGGGQLSGLLQAGEKNKPKATKETRLEVIGALGRRLLATGERQLIEASSRDRYWGIGYSVKQGPHFYKKSWGRNQLGKSLMATEQSKSADASIPRTIWYKLGPRGLSKEASEWVDGCLSKNPDWKAQYIMDDNAEEWVSNAFKDRPDIVQSYQNLSIPILRADFLRYLLLFHEGGMWFDLDVECGHGRIDDWIPPHLKANTSLVVGWEFDAGLPMDTSHQLESWTIMSAPGSPYMMQAINDITEAIHDEANEHSVPISGLKLHMLPDVVDFTGPARLTRSVFRGMEKTLGRNVDRSQVQGILEPTQLGDVLFMPGWAFAATQGEYPEKDRHRKGPRLVIHHYAGSWKNDHGGEEP